MIYFIQAGEDGAVKIGWSLNVTKRMSDLQTSHSHKLRIIRTIDAPRWVESWFHRHFASIRLAGEWFSFVPHLLTVEPPLELPIIRTETVTKSNIPALDIDRYADEIEDNGEDEGFTAEQMIQIIKAGIRHMGTQAEFATQLKVSDSQVSLALSCGLLPKRLVAALGYERVVTYRRIGGGK